MDTVVKSVISATMIVLLATASCSQDPQDSEGSPSGRSGDVGPNSNSTTRSAESSEPRRESSALNEVSVALETASPRYDADTDVVEMAIDIMSGDLRRTRSASDGTTQYEVYESELSKEVRRLGIGIPEERVWKVIAVPPSASGGMRITYSYASVFITAQRLLRLLDEVDARDEERRRTIERFMTNLRKERPQTAEEYGWILITEVRGRHGLEPLRFRGGKTGSSD